MGGAKDTPYLPHLDKVEHIDRMMRRETRPRTPSGNIMGGAISGITMHLQLSIPAVVTGIKVDLYPFKARRYSWIGKKKGMVRGGI